MNKLTPQHLDALYRVRSVACCGCGAADTQTLSDLMKFGLVESASRTDPVASPPYHVTQTGWRVLRAANEFVLDRPR